MLRSPYAWIVIQILLNYKCDGTGNVLSRNVPATYYISESSSRTLVLESQSFVTGAAV